jgi:hypothetical protein
MISNIRRLAPRAGSLLGFAAALALTLAASAALSQTPIVVELNRLEAREGSCNAMFLVRNPAAAIDELRLDLVLFDRSGVITRRINLDLGPVPGEKTQVRSFILSGVACEALGSVLLNEVSACRIGGAARSDCLTSLSLASRAGVEFFR